MGNKKDELKDKKDAPVTEKGAPAVKLKALRNFDSGGKFIISGEVITIPETVFLSEIGKGRERRIQKHPVTGAETLVSHNSTSPYINHCRVVSCSDKAKDVYDKHMKTKEV
jgi:hypothetical protein